MWFGFFSTCCNQRKEIGECPIYYHAKTIISWKIVVGNGGELIVNMEKKDESLPNSVITNKVITAKELLEIMMFEQYPTYQLIKRIFDGYLTLQTKNDLTVKLVMGDNKIKLDGTSEKVLRDICSSFTKLICTNHSKINIGEFFDAMASIAGFGVTFCSYIEIDSNIRIFKTEIPNKEKLVSGINTHLNKIQNEIKFKNTLFSSVEYQKNPDTAFINFSL